MSVTITSSLRMALLSGTGVTFNAPTVPSITTDDIYNPDNPTQTLTDLLLGVSSAKLAGSATIDGTVVGNHTLFTVPTGDKFIPTNVLFLLSSISGSGNPPSINVGYTGSFQDLIDSTRSSTFNLTGGTPFAAGSGYAPTDILTLVGGTHATTATVTVATTKLASVAVNAPGTVYAPTDTITLAGGTASTKAVLTVQTVKLVSATIAAGGTGYGSTQTFTVTVAGGTQTQTAQVSVTSNGGGVVTAVNSVSQAGSYTVLPTLSANAVTGGSGTGLTLNLVFGVNTTTITTAGSYTVNTATFTQFGTTGSGTGATFQTGLYGVNTVTVSQAGSYSVLPANHVAVTGGGGSGFTYDANWAVTASLFTNLTLAGQLLSVTEFSETAGTTGADYKYLAGGNTLSLRVDTASTYTTYSLKAFVFGFETT